MQDSLPGGDPQPLTAHTNNCETNNQSEQHTSTTNNVSGADQVSSTASTNNNSGVVQSSSVVLNNSTTTTTTAATNNSHQISASDILWWREGLNLDKANLALVGFSKGCVVLNQVIKIPIGGSQVGVLARN